MRILMFGLLFSVFALAQETALIPGLAKKRLPLDSGKVASFPAGCANYTGQWQGTCLWNGGSPPSSETVSIQQSGCQFILESSSVDYDRPLSINGVFERSELRHELGGTTFQM